MLGGGGGGNEPGGMLRSSLKRIVSTGALAGGTRGPSLAPSRLRAPRSHPLPRVASFGSDASLDSLAASTPRGDLQVGIRA